MTPGTRSKRETGKHKKGATLGKKTGAREKWVRFREERKKGKMKGLKRSKDATKTCTKMMEQSGGKKPRKADTDVEGEG